MSKHPSARGQVLLEFAVSMVGIVAFLYVIIRTWMWFNTMLVQRQASFQSTRLQAGQEASAGMSVPYQRPPLRLIGTPVCTKGNAACK